MPDMSVVSTIFTSIKTATDIAKLLKDADFSLEKADLKLKIAELVSALADVKMQTTEMQDVLSSRDLQIKELKDSLELKCKVTKLGDAYYKLNDDGKPTGDPFCLNCWESKNKLLHLSSSATGMYIRSCPSCKTNYNGRGTVPITEK